MMQVDKEGWLSEVERIVSPNFDQRPEQSDVSLLVIHGISLPPGEYGGGCITDLFCNTLDCDAHPYFDQLRELKVSSHVLIQRDGHIIQYVSFNDRAWHAGVSRFDGRERCNDFSIGIELEGVDDQPYEDVQYEKLSEVTTAIMQAYPAITSSRVAGHSDIAPGRKTDPGSAFDWKRYKNLLPIASTK